MEGCSSSKYGLEKKIPIVYDIICLEVFEFEAVLPCMRVGWREDVLRSKLNRRESVNKFVEKDKTLILPSTCEGLPM